MNKMIKLLLVMLLLLPSYTVFATEATVHTYAGNGVLGLKDGVKLDAQFRFPSFVTVDQNGNVYVSDSRNHLIRKVDKSGDVSTVAGFRSERNEYGQPSGGFVDGPIKEAEFNEPQGIAVDGQGVIYVADSKNGAIRKIEDGHVSTVVAGLDLPVGIVVADNGELYVSETLAHRILKITSDGDVTVVAGGSYDEEDGWLLGGYQDGVGEEAQFNEPTGLVLSKGGTLYVSDTANQRIRSISSDRVVSTVAGSGDEIVDGTTYIVGGYQDGSGDIARFRSPHGLTIAEDGTLYVADMLNHRIRSIATDGTVATVAGTDKYGHINDASLKSTFDHPYDVLLLGSDRLLVVDYWNHSLRMIDDPLIADNLWSGSNFKDVAESHRFVKEINYLFHLKIIFGYSDLIFAPDDTVTRAMAAIMIGRALELNGVQKSTQFSDVTSSNSASGFIQSAADRGIIKGFPDGTFRPDEPVTRAQMANLLARAFELTEKGQVSYSDVSVEAEAYPSIQKLSLLGITKGYPDGTFRPEKPLTRAEFSAFLARALNEAFR